jgi:hypothetical protein
MAHNKPTPNSGLPEKDPAAYLASGFLVGGGRFSLLRELARGGMGVVWLAHDERLMSSVALKFLPEAVRAKPAALNDLRQETKKSRMLSHPNIIRIYDLYEAPDEVAFISMEYVDGPSLWTLQSQQPKGFFSWDYLIPIVRQLCEALDYAHGESVIHRDLKPANMLLDERQRLRLADFGVAARVFESVASDTESNRASGTVSYMSPQQIEGAAARVGDDIYALGATLYELLSGHPPFYQNDIAYQVRYVLATPLSERLADLEVENDVPPAVADTIMACLSKDPEKRPQSARAVMEWLGATDSTILPATRVTSAVLPAPEASGATKEKTEATTAPASASGSDALTPARENEVRRRLALLVGVAGLGVLTLLAWGRFIPRMMVFPPSTFAPNTNAVDLPGINVSNPAPIQAPNPASTPALSGIVVGVEFGQVNRERGLREVTGLDDGVTAPANIGGKECRLLVSHSVQSHPRARCYFQISPAFKRRGAMNARIEVEYYAASPGAMQIHFDGVPSRQTIHYTNGGKISFDGTGGWKTTNYQLNNALFHNGESGGADFRLTTSCRELYIHRVTVFFDQ